MRVYAEGRVKVNDLISNKLPISELRPALDQVKVRKAIKALIYPEI
jgi:Zn-dependent alcohol dehydrogenase